LPFIGNQPAESYSAFQKQDFSTSATTSYTLDHPVSNQNEIALFINFVRQEPTAAYTASGTTLTLTSATASSDDMYCIYLGKAVQTVNPPSGSVGNSQVASTIITGQTAETSIATDDTVLIHDTSAGALRKMTRANFVSGIGGTNASGFLVTKSANQSISADTWTHVTLDQEIFDTDSVFASSTFTVPSTGKYYIFAHARVDTINTRENIQLALYKGGSFFSGIFNDRVYANDSGHEIFCHFSGIVSLTASDEIKLYARASSNAESVSGNSVGTPTGIESYTGMGAFKLIE